MTALADEVAEMEGEPVTETEAAPEVNPDARCEAETHAGGNTYRCALEGEHEGEHAFTIDTETGVIEDTPIDESATELAMLDANKKVARAAQTYWNKVREQYGDDLGGFHECPLCVSFPPGLFWPSDLPSEKVAALKQLLGQPALDNYKRDNAYMSCATCDGLGTVLTGSKVPAHMTRQCADCAGKGWLTEDAKRLTTPPTPPVLSVVDEPALESPPPFDPWQRAFGDPDYYRMPIPDPPPETDMWGRLLDDPDFFRMPLPGVTT